MAGTRMVQVDRHGGEEYPDDLYRTTERAQVLTGLDAVGEAAVADYRAQGYLAVSDVLDAGRVTEALAALESLVLDPGGAGVEFEAWAAHRLPELDGPARLDAVRKFMWFVDHEPRLHALAHDPLLRSVAGGLAGTDDVELFQDMALIKPPGGGREKPWHQDNAYFTIAAGTPIVGVWIALDEATAANGCMHVVPGSHLDGPVVHFRRRDWQICDTDVQAPRAVAVPLPPGGALFFDGLLHHGTPANRTRQRRRAVQFHYLPASAQRVTDQERLAVFGSEGKDVTC